MKQHLLSVIFALCTTVCAYAQSDFEHAQTRIQEGMSEFFIRPMVAELQMIKTECQEWPPFNIYPGVSLSEITSEMLENAKSNAAYKAAMLAGADIILGATFFVQNNKKKKGLDVTVRGFPAKYVKFHSYGNEPEDSKWIEPLQEGARIRAYTGEKKEKAVQTVTQK